MRNSLFKSFVECVRHADANDPIWYAGYLWTDLTSHQVDAVTSVLTEDRGVEIVTWDAKVVGVERKVYRLPSGLKLYNNEDMVLGIIKNDLECVSNTISHELLSALYKTDYINCGEYNMLCDWVEEHTDGNGRVSKGW